MTTTLPLNALRTFAAARHQYFARAADELHVTIGAISRHIRLLEAELGQPLFEHQPQGMRLTAQDHVLAADIAPPLEGPTRAVDRAWIKSRVLTISAPPTFSQEWLLRRLVGRRDPPAAMRMGLCGMQSSADPGATGRARRPAGLSAAACRVAWRRSGRLSSRSITWQDGFARQQVPLGGSLRGPHYSLSGMALQQAAASKGVALGGGVLAQRLLTSSALVSRRCQIGSTSCRPRPTF